MTTTNKVTILEPLFCGQQTQPIRYTLNEKIKGVNVPINLTGATAKIYLLDKNKYIIKTLTTANNTLFISSNEIIIPPLKLSIRPGEYSSFAVVITKNQRLFNNICRSTWTYKPREDLIKSVKLLSKNLSDYEISKNLKITISMVRWLKISKTEEI